MTQTYSPGRPLVQEDMADADQHRRQIARVVNLAMRGQTNNGLTLTLDPGVATTTITDARISLQTAVLMMPATASAATEIGNGTLWVVPVAGSAVVHHANSGVADRVFAVALVG